MKQSRVFDLSPQAVWLIVNQAAQAAGLTCAPHDLRRTCAKLMRAGGAPLEQISLTLGHASLKTTERYLGMQLELRPGKAAGDYIKMQSSESES